MALADTGPTAERPPLDQLLWSHPVPTWRVVAWPVMILMVSMMVWAYFSELEEFTIATGEIVPLGKVKVVQHLEGGIIEELFVKDGDLVKEGQPLLQLDLGSGGTNLEELQVRMDSAVLSAARLEAESTGNPLEFPPDAAERRPDMVIAQRQTYEARGSEFESSLGILREQVNQKKLEVDELEAQRKAIAKNLKIARERFTISASLLSEGLTARIEHLELEAAVESLEGELNSLTPAIPRARAAIAESQERVTEAERRFRREAKEELSDSQQNIARVSELLIQASQQGVRAEIKSPADGIIQNMVYNSVGGVVRAGEPIMEIVPTGELLVVEARLNPTDRGYVELGQRAMVKISTYDFARYGGLEGTVVQLAPDSSTDENGEPYFRVIIETERSYLGLEEGDLPITPGMQASVDIRTGTRSVMEYLVKPVLKLKHEAFRER